MWLKPKNAIPVLITPVGRLNYTDDEFLLDFGDYCNAMKELAEENEVFLIDLMKKSILIYHLLATKLQLGYL